TQQAKIAADDGDSDDDFGASVALSSYGSTALIGAAGDEDPNGDEAGSAYVFE
ncbi:FG-GAP repeat protein, partial [Haloarcula laminariae]|uniref:FG-GAP repeat protein n=1 Tax=Haloarcula laminariae TaxID=2961577 RepID=UPI0024068B2D